jgi:glycosyltransferase involved in cell wall biosynthesis
MNILIISSELYPLKVGGIGVHVYFVSMHLSKQNHLFLLVPIESKSIKNKLKTCRLHVNIFLIRLLPFPLSGISFIINAALVYLLHKRERLDIIHVHCADVSTTACGYLISKLSGTPFIVSAHGSEVRLKKNTFIKFVQRLLISKATVITCVSRDIMKILMNEYRVGREKIFIVPNGYDEALSLSPLIKLENYFKIVFVGSLREVKDPMTLIKGFEIIAKKYSNIRLFIIGDGPKYRELSNYCVKKRLIEKVSFLKQLSHEKTINMVAASDVFVLTSIEEGLPTALIEAMALGKPVVVTNVGGIPEVVKNEINGLLVPPRSPENVAKALERLLNDCELRKKLGRAAKESMQNYSWNKIAEKYERIYYKLLREAESFKND